MKLGGLLNYKGNQRDRAKLYKVTVKVGGVLKELKKYNRYVSIRNALDKINDTYKEVYISKKVDGIWRVIDQEDFLKEHSAGGNIEEG